MTCGIAVIDESLGDVPGDLPLTILGRSGTGKTVLALQMATVAAMRGQSALFITAESGQAVYQQANSLVPKLNDLMQCEQLVLLEQMASAPFLLKTHGMKALVESLKKEHANATVWVFDSIDCLFEDIFSVEQMRSCLQQMVAAGREQGCRMVFTLSEEPSREGLGLKRVLTDLSGATLQLKEYVSAGRELSVVKSRLGEPKRPKIGFEIGENGLIPTLSAILPQLEGQMGGVRDAVPINTRVRTLVVTEDIALERHLERSFKNHLSLSMVNDATNAFEQYLLQAPDMIILDNLCGHEAVNRIINALRSHGSVIPIVVLAHFVGRSTDRLQLISKGATAVLNRHASPFELLHKIHSLSHHPEWVSKSDAESIQSVLMSAVDEPRGSPSYFKARWQRALHLDHAFGVQSTLAEITLTESTQLDTVHNCVQEYIRDEDAVMKTADNQLKLLLGATDSQVARQAVQERLKHKVQRAAPELHDSVQWRYLQVSIPSSKTGFLIENNPGGSANHRGSEI